MPTPNIWTAPDTYELENRALDRGCAIEAAMRQVCGPDETQGWSGLDVLDIGCGTGYHLPRFAETARSVVGVEPHPPLLDRARARVAGLEAPEGVRVLAGTAAATGLPTDSIDLAHARWAYFFGPGCEPGLAELDRVVRPGGVAFVVDNDTTRSTFGAWFRRSRPDYDPEAVRRFWTRRGWTRIPLDVGWEFDRRGDLEAVVRLELAPAIAESVLDEHPSTASVDYAVDLWWHRF